MKNFAEYYKDLLEWEDVKFRELISDWQEDLIEEIQKDFQLAINESGLKGLTFAPNKTNQSIGNQIANLITQKLNEYLKCYEIKNCPGKGYPDRILAKDDFKQIAFEIKATSSWNDEDTLRRVLTSSSKKLRKNFVSPIYHVLCSITYQNQSGAAKIEGLRLDFIETQTPISARLEASVNHKLLTSGTHTTIKF